jgi:hypothetical protein
MAWLGSGTEVGLVALVTELSAVEGAAAGGVVVDGAGLGEEVEELVVGWEEGLGFPGRGRELGLVGCFCDGGDN